MDIVLLLIGFPLVMLIIAVILDASIAGNCFVALLLAVVFTAMTYLVGYLYDLPPSITYQTIVTRSFRVDSNGQPTKFSRLVRITVIKIDYPYTILKDIKEVQIEDAE